MLDCWIVSPSGQCDADMTVNAQVMLDEWVGINVSKTFRKNIVETESRKMYTDNAHPPRRRTPVLQVEG